MTYFVEPVNTVKNYNYCENAFIPRYVTISLDEIGRKNYECKAKIGDIVKEGDVIAELVEDNKTSYIHSSVPGKVVDIITCNTPNGKKGFGIKIEFGGKFTYFGKIIKPVDYTIFNSTLIIEKLINNGVINTFNLSKITNLGEQIKAKNEAKNIIIRLFDEDNFRITDSVLTKINYTILADGAKVLKKAANADGIVFAIDQKCELKNEIHSFENEYIKVVEMNIKRYPSGTEREIISAYTRSTKKNGTLNLSKKDIFIDASTLIDVYNAVVLNKPVVSKSVYFSGNCLNATGFLNVRLGTSIKDVINQLGGFTKQPAAIIVNGTISGNTIHGLDVPITKYVKSVTFIPSIKKTNSHVYDCIKCGSCRIICPVKISPDVIYRNVSDLKAIPEIVANTAVACTNCGLCNTVCPSRLPLCQTINNLKEYTTYLQENKNEK